MIISKFPDSKIGVDFQGGLSKSKKTGKSWGLELGVRNRDGGEEFRIKSRNSIAEFFADGNGTGYMSNDNLRLEMVQICPDDPKTVDIIKLDKSINLELNPIKLEGGWNVSQSEEDGVYVQTLTNNKDTAMQMYSEDISGIRGTKLQSHFPNDVQLAMELQQQSSESGLVSEVIEFQSSIGHAIKGKLIDKVTAYPHSGIVSDELVDLASYSQTSESGDSLPLFGHVLDEDTNWVKGLVINIGGINASERLTSSNVVVHGLTMQSGIDELRLERWINSLGNLSTRITQTVGTEVGITDTSILSNEFWEKNRFENGFLVREVVISKSDHWYLGERYMFGKAEEQGPNVSVLANVVVADNVNGNWQLVKPDEMTLASNWQLVPDGENYKATNRPLPDIHKRSLAGVMVGYDNQGHLEIDSGMKNSFWRLSITNKDEIDVTMALVGLDGRTQILNARVGDPELKAMVTVSDIPHIVERLEQVPQFDTLLNDLYGGVMGREVVSLRLG